ncbi:helix-turn-helix transcriptional regulator [Kaistella sp.]|uniref:helix-turn-helix transcriptional regulator n=1 Tax=Kaistella sp. TaxID=2782235 RepID=UPI002F948340
MKNTSPPRKYSIKNIKKTSQHVVDFNFYSFEQFLKDAEHLTKSHRHDFYTFVLTVDGVGSHIIDFEEYEIKPRRLFFINYDQIHSWKLDGPIHGKIILFSKSFYNLIYTGNSDIRSDTALEILPTYVDIEEEDFSSWLSVCGHIEHEFKKSEKFSEEVTCLLLKTCVLKMERIAENSNPASSRTDHKSMLVDAFKKLVNVNFRELKTTSDYAHELSITANYLNALVKESLGKPAGTVIRNRVILEAKRLLSHSDLSVRQISLELGFTDNSHFGKYFKKSTGLTPDTYRKNSINN